MSLIKNKPLMLSVVAILAGMKFVIMPIVEWQDEKISVMHRQETQLNKGLTLLEGKETLVSSLTALSKKREALSKELLGEDQNATSYQLRVQKVINTLIEKNDLRARNSNWLTPLDKGGIEEHRLELSFSGKQKNFIQFLLDIEQQKPKIAVYELTSGISNMATQRGNLGNVNGKVILVGWRTNSVSGVAGG